MKQLCLATCQLPRWDAPLRWRLVTGQFGDVAREHWFCSLPAQCIVLPAECGHCRKASRSERRMYVASALKTLALRARQRVSGLCYCGIVFREPMPIARFGVVCFPTECICSIWSSFF